MNDDLFVGINRVKDPLSLTEQEKISPLNYWPG